MLTITTTMSNNTKGRTVVAKGHGKQRTIAWDNHRTADYNNGRAVGALLGVLVNAEQAAKLLHPSGRQRIRVDGNRWTIDV